MSAADKVAALLGAAKEVVGEVVNDELGIMRHGPSPYSLSRLQKAIAALEPHADMTDDVRDTYRLIWSQAAAELDRSLTDTDSINELLAGWRERAEKGESMPVLNALTPVGARLSRERARALGFLVRP